MNLTQRLFIFGLIALLPAFALVAWLELELRDAREAEVFRNAARQTQQAASEISRLVDEMETLLTAVSLAPIVRRGPWPDCDRYAAELVDGTDHLAGIGVIGPDGTLLCTSSPSEARPNYADRRYFQMARDTRAFVVGEVTSGRIAPTVSRVPFARPIIGADDQFLGVVVAALDVRRLDQIIARWGLPPGGSFTVADRDGIIVARAPEPERFVGTRIPEAYLHWVDAPTGGTERVTSQDGTVRILSYKPVGMDPKGLYISSGFSVAAAFADVDEARRKALWTIAAGLVATLGVAALVGRYFIRAPVDGLVALADAWRSGRPYPATNIHGPEFVEIASALEAMGHELKMRESQARANEDRLRLAVRSVPFPLMLAAEDGAILEASRSWFTPFASPDQPACAHAWFAAALVDPQPDDLLLDLFSQSDPVTGLQRNVRAADGSLRIWDFALVPLPGREGERRLCLVAAADVTDRQRASEQQALLLRELNHRVKNTLAMVQAIAGQTFPRGGDNQKALDDFGQRLAALARTHDLLTTAGWQGASLRAILEAEIAHVPSPERIRLSGDDVEIAPQAAVSMGLILHELATNAVKYGALSRADGHLSVTWGRRDGPADEGWHFHWVERGGPLVAPPERQGFGSRLISHTAADLGNGKLDFRPEGVELNLIIRPDVLSPATTPGAAGPKPR